MPKFIIDINPYFIGGRFNTGKLIVDIKANAIAIENLKFMDFIDAGNGVYAFLYGDDIIYFGKCSSRSFCERISSHISKSPQGYMNNVMKKIAWLCSSKNLSKYDFLIDANESDRTESFIKAEKIMKDIKIACMSFDSYISVNKSSDIGRLEKELISLNNPLLNRRNKSLSSIKNRVTLLKRQQYK